MIKPSVKAKPYQARNLMLKYKFESKEDECYIAEVPELPGCMADGADRVDALKNIEEIICEWIETARLEGRTIPEPKGRLIYA